jgi:hypothetical protein
LAERTKGYETGSLAIGIASTKSDPSKPHEWEKLNAPVLSANDADVRWWENRKLYKSSIIWDKKKLTGHSFVMYYKPMAIAAVINPNGVGLRGLAWLCLMI